MIRRLALVLMACACGPPAPPPMPTVNDCEPSAYVDRSAASADRRIGFGTALNSGAVSYEPRCMRIAPGQSVTFVGDFSTHPLSASSQPTPLTRHESGSADYTVAFPDAGLFGYICELHEPTMAGAIWVR